MGFPLYLYSKPVQYIPFPIIVRVFPSIAKDFSLHMHMLSYKIFFFWFNYAFASNTCTYMKFHVVITPPNLKSTPLNSLKFIQKSSINEYSVRALNWNCHYCGYGGKMTYLARMGVNATLLEAFESREEATISDR